MIVDRVVARHWYERWEAQQELYAGDREERFERVLDVIEAVRDRPRVIVDLGSGPGSLAARAVRRFPHATVVAVDVDPFLIALGSAVHPGVEFVRADVGADGWTDTLGSHAGSIDAIVSSTALHYPRREVLVDIYRECHRLLESRAVLIDADQFYPTHRTWNDLLSAVDVIHAARTAVTPHEDWAGWWRAAESEPAFGDLFARRAQVIPAHEQDNGLSIDDHVALMRGAGFAAAGPVWQHGRSAVLAALTGIRLLEFPTTSSRHVST